MAKSENINELALALSKVQGSLSPAKKDSNNPFFKSKYADLTSVWDSCRQELASNHISIVQSADDTETHLVVKTTLMHSSGQWIDGTSMLEKTITNKDNTKRNMTAQEIGASTTYLRRFAVASMVGVCTEDDDGNTASGNSPTKTSSFQISPRIEPKMSSSQSDELKDLLSKCDPNYRTMVYDYMHKQYNAFDISELPAILFNSMKAKAFANSQKVSSNEKISPIKFEQSIIEA